MRRFPQARNVPIVEIACVKDYPGAWAEYRIHEGGYTQLTRRIDAPDALAWTEKTRHMFAGLYRDYALGYLDAPLLHPRGLTRCRRSTGLRVIDMATVFAGPGAARHLADFGADVVKVESPAGDGVRRMGWFPPDGGDSYTWKLLGRNKRAIVLDLKTDAGPRRAAQARRRRRRARSRTSGPARSNGSASAPTCSTRATRGSSCCASPASARTARTRRARASRRWPRR